MKAVRDIHEKIVCMVDPLTKTVEIVRRDAKTVVQFVGDGHYHTRTIKIENKRKS